MKIIGYGINLMYQKELGYERVVSFVKKEDAENAYEIIKKSTEYYSAKAIELLVIKEDDDDFTYETIKEEVK